VRNYQIQGIIIKRKNVGEADRIITVFSKNHGKIRIKAPGVRKITSRRSSHIELFNISVLNLYQSLRGSIPLLTEANVIEDFRIIKKDLKKIGFAFYICELLDNLCPERQENRKIFYLTQEIFEKLEGSLEEEEKIVDEFEENILSFLGFIPESFALSNRQNFIENIIEKKMRTKDILPLLIS